MGDSRVFLTQTDTTVGFLSQDDKKLNDLKKRPQKQKILQAISSFVNIQSQHRVPKKFRKLVRRSSKTTFILPDGNSFRKVAPSSRHYDFICKYKSLYSTSANKSKQSYNYNYAYSKCDVVVQDFRGLFESKPSQIVVLGKCRKKRLRA